MFQTYDFLPRGGSGSLRRSMSTSKGFLSYEDSETEVGGDMSHINFHPSRSGIYNDLYD